MRRMAATASKLKRRQRHRNRMLTLGTALCLLGALTTPAWAEDAPTQVGSEAGTVIPFETLSPAAQFALAESACAELTNGTVVFTCEDEVTWAGELQAPLEAIEALVDISNFLLDNSSSADTLAAAVTGDISGGVAAQTSDEAIAAYTSAFTSEGTGYEVTTEELLQLSVGPITVEATAPGGTMRFSISTIRSITGIFRCGFFGHDVPKRAAPTLLVGKLANPEAYLRNLGYHQTDSRLFGPGWTRPQTYKWAICGFSTFRDHGGIGACGTKQDASTNYELVRACQVYEQVYHGDPGGEPNPEVYRSGPWPYALWPVYVRAWHRSH